MTLYVVATPIGNLGELSGRAREVLDSVDFVCAEDTRRTGAMFQALGIEAELVAYHDHSGPGRRELVVGRLEGGETAALVSDAGTPAINDPGYRLVRAARSAGLTVSPIAGPSALTAFLSVAGLPTDRFQFVGFAPRRAGERSAFIDALERSEQTTVFFESPKRVAVLAYEIAEAMPEREMAVGRELTKRYEELVFGTARDVSQELTARERIRGEIICGVGPRDVTAESVDAGEARAWAAELIAAGLSVRTVSRILRRRLGCSRDDAYDAALRAESDEEA